MNLTTSFYVSLLLFSHLKEGQHFRYLNGQEGMRKSQLTYVPSTFKAKITNYICLKLFMRYQLPKTNKYFPNCQIHPDFNI